MTALMSATPTETKRIGYAIVAIMFLVHLSASILVLTRGPFPSDLDELEHFSYAIQMARNPQIFSDYTNMQIVDLNNPGGYLERKNYLTHPTLYYHLLALVADPDDASIEDNAFRLRLANLAVSATAILMLLLIGRRILKNPEALLIYAAVIAITPKAAVLGGMINNDNLALLASALTFAGLVRLMKNGIAIPTAVMIGAGFAIGSWAKLSAGVLLGLWILFCHLPALGKLPRANRNRTPYVICLLIFVAVGVAPYVVNLFTYGFPLFTGHWVGNPGEKVQTLGLGLFLYQEVEQFFLTWATFTFDAGDFLSLSAVLGLAALGTWQARFRHHPEHPSIPARLAIAGVAVFAGTLVINFAFAYKMYLDLGLLSAMAFRYYLPIWTAIAIAAALGVSAIKAQPWKHALIIGLPILLFYSHTAPLVADLLAGL